MSTTPAVQADAPYPPPSFIDPQSLMRIRSLELRARAVVEGFIAGLHRSPYHGFSVEFSEYRQYVPGDDPRYLDWRLFARSDRFFVKRFEDETNLRCLLLLDNSTSMTFASLDYNKAEYAKTLAATLSYFLSSQRDAVGILRFAEGPDEYVPPRHRVGQFRRIVVALEREPAGTATGLLSSLDQAAAMLRHRGLVVLLTDLLVPIDGFAQRLSYLRAAGQDVAVFQILDPAELDFPFEEPSLFEDAESGEQVYVDPTVAREDYLGRLQTHLDACDEACRRAGVDLMRLRTDTPLENALSTFLRMRTRVVQPGRR